MTNLRPYPGGWTFDAVIPAAPKSLRGARPVRVNAESREGAEAVAADIESGAIDVRGFVPVWREATQ